MKKIWIDEIVFHHDGEEDNIPGHFIEISSQESIEIQKENDKPK